jgi:hypothetical protein
MRVLLLGARAPSSAVLGYFGGLPGPSCTIKSLPTLEPLTYPGVNFLLYKRPAAQPTHWRVIEASFSMVNVLEKRRGRVCADSNIIKIIFHHVEKNACDIYIYKHDYKFLFLYGYIYDHPIACLNVFP